MRFSHSCFKALCFPVFLSLVIAAPLEQRDLISVKLTEVGNAIIEATISNTGPSAISLLKLGSILDEKAQTRKVTITKNGTVVPFNGVYINYHFKNLKELDFVTVPARGSIKKTIDLAINHDLTQSGTYNVSTSGIISLGEPGTVNVSDIYATFSSNTLDISIDGSEVAKIDSRGIDAAIQSGCNSSQQSSLGQGFIDAITLSRLGAQGATSGSASKFQEYFRTSDANARSTVTARFNGVATALATSSTAVRVYCTDIVDFCSQAVAYTMSETNQVVFCPDFWDMEQIGTYCHYPGRAEIILHEFTHAPASYSPGTDDFAYDYGPITKLSASQALLNADTYQLYTNALNLNC